MGTLLNGKVVYTINEECWECTSHVQDKYGYCKINFSGKTQLLHRVIYQEYNGAIPEGFVILHECDNPKCINPNHLRAGTHADNVIDRVSKNRSAIGERHGRSKLKENDVIEIFLNTTETANQLANRFNVSPRAIRAIWERKNWKSVTNLLTDVQR
jgi:hypothetical protein